MVTAMCSLRAKEVEARSRAANHPAFPLSTSPLVVAHDLAGMQSTRTHTAFRRNIAWLSAKSHQARKVRSLAKKVCGTVGAAGAAGSQRAQQDHSRATAENVKQTMSTAGVQRDKSQGETPAPPRCCPACVWLLVASVAHPEPAVPCSSTCKAGKHAQPARSAHLGLQLFGHLRARQARPRLQRGVRAGDKELGTGRVGFSGKQGAHTRTLNAQPRAAQCEPAKPLHYRAAQPRAWAAWQATSPVWHLPAT